MKSQGSILPRTSAPTRTALRTKAARRRATAYHEAGHAVMAELLGHQVQKAIIHRRPLPRQLGHCEIKLLHGNKAGWVQFYLAGPIAAGLATGGAWDEDGDGRDLRDIKTVLKEWMGREYRKESTPFCCEVARATCRILKAYWPVVVTVAELLLRKGTVNQATVAAAVAQFRIVSARCGIR